MEKLEKHCSNVRSHLTAGNCDCRGWGESGNDRQGEEVNEESKAKKPSNEDDDASEEGEQDGVLWSIAGDLCCHQRHDGRWANVDVFLAASVRFLQSSVYPTDNTFRIWCMQNNPWSRSKVHIEAAVQQCLHKRSPENININISISINININIREDLTNSR